MKLRTEAKYAAIVGVILFLACLCGQAIIAQTAGKSYRAWGRNTNFTQDIYFSKQIALSVASNVSLTSPTVIFSVAGKSPVIVLNSNGNQTAHALTGGELGEVKIIKAGAGSNTAQFDDSASMTLGASRVLTEGNNSTLGVICTSADGDEWAQLFYNAN